MDWFAHLPVLYSHGVLKRILLAAHDGSFLCVLEKPFEILFLDRIAFCMCTSQGKDQASSVLQPCTDREHLAGIAGKRGSVFVSGAFHFSI